MTAIATAGTTAGTPGQLFDLDKLDREEALRRRMLEDLPLRPRALKALAAIAAAADLAERAAAIATKDLQQGRRRADASVCAPRHLLAERAGQSLDTFKLAITELAKTAWLSVQHTPGGASVYTVHWAEIFDSCAPCRGETGITAPAVASSPGALAGRTSTPSPSGVGGGGGGERVGGGGGGGGGESAIYARSRRVIVASPENRVGGGVGGGGGGGSHVLHCNAMNESKDSLSKTYAGAPPTPPTGPPGGAQAEQAGGRLLFPATSVEQLRDPGRAAELWRRVVAAGLLPETFEWQLRFYAVLHGVWRRRSDLRNPVGFLLHVLRSCASREGRSGLLRQYDDEHDLAWAKSVLCPDTRPRLSEGERESQEVRERDQRKRELRQQMKQVAATFGAK